METDVSMGDELQVNKNLRIDFGSGNDLNTSQTDSPRIEFDCFNFQINDEQTVRKSKHVLEMVDSDNHNVLVRAVNGELSLRGIEIETSSRARNKNKSTPRGGSFHENTNGIHKLVEAQLNHCDVKVSIPFIIKESCEYIRQHITTQGIFRKSGSAARAQCIWQRFIRHEACPISANDTVFEVASVLKQYLREMVVPVIPFDCQSILVKCLESEDISSRIETVLLAVCMLPIPNLNILTYLMQFLFEVTQQSHHNSMGYKNLAIVIGPNIMPIEQKKGEKLKVALNSEVKVLEIHAKVIEILIQYGDYVGFLTNSLEKCMEGYIVSRNSEDELENDTGKRKKRRSGSLTRVLGFLKKVTNNKNGDNPVPVTPGDDIDYTPIIKGSTKKRMRDELTFSQNKKKTILDVVRSTGLNGDNGRYCSMPDTPNSLSALIACPSPAICLNPSPMKSDWKNTPNGVRLKNLVTPSLLRRKAKKSPTVAQSAEVTKSDKHKSVFNKKHTKKKQVISKVVDCRKNLASQRTASSVSIHRLANSPRAGKMIRNTSNSKIPRRENSRHTLRRENSSSSGASNKSRETVTPSMDLKDTLDGSGEYVVLSSTATVNDEKNEAFIASSISFNDSIPVIDSEPIQQLRLTPLIQEIDSLTLSAQNDVSPLDGRLTSRVNKSDLGCPTTLNRVEDKFNKAVKESKIINIIQGVSDKKTVCNIQRRFSVQEKGVSPSQRKIRAVRRKSHEIGRVVPAFVPTPKYFSLRSPKSRVTPPPELSRSPSRCTLRRGRPNTMRVGLARPSPVRSNNSKVNSSTTLCMTPSTPVAVESELLADETKSTLPKTPEAKYSEAAMEFQFPIPTPLRRMSSVHELVQIMEKTAKSKIMPSTQIIGNVAAKSSAIPRPMSLVLDASDKAGAIEKTKTQRTRLTPTRNPTISEQEEMLWTDATQFNFGRLSQNSQRSKAERDSIHVLKTLHAGKVSENVKLFDGMLKKSPAKSLIPRLTSLHVATAASNTNVRKAGSMYIKADSRGRPKTMLPSETRKMIRRFSAVELKNKHEQKLELVKKEITVRRSATTSGTSTTNQVRKDKMNNRRVYISPKDKVSVKGKRRGVESAATTPSQENPQMQESFPVILEDESLTTSVKKAIHNILGSNCKLDFADGSHITVTPVHGSPLKSSNLANVNSNKDNSTPRGIKSPVSLIRVASERGTRSTSNSQTVSSTPRIKKALTTRAYDLLHNPKNNDSTFCTPRRPRRVGRENLDLILLPNMKTPLKAQHNVPC